MEHLIGAHQSTSGGYHKAVESVGKIGGNCLQIFSTSPRGWRSAKISDEDIELFKKKKEELGIDPIYFHASYLINLAGSPENQEKSKDSLISEMNTASRVGVKGSIIHIGSFKDKDENQGLFDQEKYKNLLGNINEILEKTPEETLFIIENMGTRKIGRTMEEIGFLVNELDNSRVRVCLDTCHLHVAGFDLSTDKKLSEFLNKFDKLVGLDKLEVIHLNDSRDELGSLRDRHENIGDGFVGGGVFRSLLNHSKTKNIPFILETPGIDGGGPDKENIDRVKKMIK